MKIKRYVATTVEQALQEVKADLGQQAIILETRRHRPRLGLFGAQRFEVVAAVDGALRVASDRRGMAGAVATGGSKGEEPLPLEIPRVASRVYGAAGAVPVIAPARPPGPSERSEPCAPAHLRPVEQSGPSGEIPLADLTDLLACDLQPDTAEALLRGGVDTGSDAFRSRLEQIASRRFQSQAAESVNARTVALVGPTGTGKTTTLAKLAARAALMEDRRVALITLDTYRVGAVEQLRTYAEILEVPCLVAYTGEDLRRRLAETADADLVLIDTAGRAPHDALALGRLRQALREVVIDEIHLVVAAHTRLGDAGRLRKSYQALGVNRLLFTKLDETLALGSLLEIPRRIPLPVSFFTFGQSVPDDIEPASPERAAQRIIAGLTLLREGRLHP